MTEDIRDKASADPRDLTALNFVREHVPYVFRRHFRQGLRSHVLEVLDPGDVRAEQDGRIRDGIREFPRARPIRMFRVFRKRFRDLDDGLGEIRKVKTVERFLAPDFMARSHEFLVDYAHDGVRDILLCGLQEYVEGEALDLWSPLGKDLLDEITARVHAWASGPRILPLDRFRERARERAATFVDRIKRMVHQAASIPDLAGVSNLILTPKGSIKLVDINNVSPVSFSPHLFLDDKGYPICDTSVQALALLEQNILDRPPDRNERLYGVFLDPERIRRVRDAQKAFDLSLVRG